MRDAVDCAPVILLVFNRPAQTRRVFAAIQEARPSRLYVAADGPRELLQSRGRTLSGIVGIHDAACASQFVVLPKRPAASGSLYGVVSSAARLLLPLEIPVLIVIVCQVSTVVICPCFFLGLRVDAGHWERSEVRDH